MLKKFEPFSPDTLWRFLKYAKNEMFLLCKLYTFFKLKRNSEWNLIFFKQKN